MNVNDIILVTGSSSGMGKATAIELARTGATVVMLCRNKERGEKALYDIKRESGNDKVDLFICDLGNMASIRSFAIEFKKKYKKLNVLVNNAGVILPGRHETSDGYELQFGVNHLGVFLLTNLLLETIVCSTPARIINVASGAHKAGRIHFDDINLKKNYSLFKAYSQSKLANILFTYTLSEKLKGSGVTVNCLHPGAVATDMGINRNTGFGTLITKVIKPFFLTPLEGAATAIYLSISPEVQGVTGKYYYKKRPIESSKLSYDKEIGNRLWKLSEELTGLTQ